MKHVVNLSANIMKKKLLKNVSSTYKTSDVNKYMDETWLYLLIGHLERLVCHLKTAIFRHLLNIRAEIWEEVHIRVNTNILNTMA